MPDFPQPIDGFAIRYNPDDPAPQSLGATDRGIIGVKHLKAGTKSAPEHYETADSFAFIRDGKGRVIGSNNEVLAELGKGDSVVLPAKTSFSFEAASGEDFEVFQFFASHVAFPSDFAPFS